MTPVSFVRSLSANYYVNRDGRREVAQPRDVGRALLGDGSE